MRGIPYFVTMDRMLYSSFLFLLVMVAASSVTAQPCKDWVVYEYPVTSTVPATVQDTVITQAIRTVGHKANLEKDKLEIWVYQNQDGVNHLYLGRQPRFRERDHQRLVGLSFDDGSFFRHMGESELLIPPTGYLEYHYLIQPLTDAQIDHFLKHGLRFAEVEIKTKLETKIHRYYFDPEESERLQQSLRCMTGRQ